MKTKKGFTLIELLTLLMTIVIICWVLVFLASGCNYEPKKDKKVFKAFDDSLQVTILAEFNSNSFFGGVQKKGRKFFVELEAKDNNSYRVELWRHQYRSRDEKIREIEIKDTKKHIIDLSYHRFPDTPDLDLHEWVPISRIECYTARGGELVSKTFHFSIKMDKL